ncbi:MAG TPA: pyridoxamine 5'-phosphate oxidase family protein [Clostridiales bacterium]|jgi:nitroimidazol reductase NimA-like FMN-containing flavoprotein (pyridoxamine 5'-phosphate oxidase superfamily)|nr:pyridoxamine 5'-phosphate oxidase family protein [Clostridiales bacterium]HOJ34972.1 pyridoxamine 5'-phosphate oxidase family protein [Clostridiales bacterium]HOL78846.1 pyridoxamine 5'-phosphate oxidase family protein [Clostridiales bacterium]HPP68410.1 pyridoxamine 5'-phosphate oxidase family protein [Clostridiales bacterium]HPU67722.1 pyridoxamine 5'-phosphate oxidase family protein [Clostridiales bacterium]
MMFRPMRRFKQAVSEEECRKILREEWRAAFSVIGDEGYPYTIPINFYYEESENRIYFHGAKEGHKVSALEKCDKVCFTVWNQGYKKEGHWEWYVTSVIIFGRARLVNDRKITEDKLRKLALKYFPTQEEAEEVLARSIDKTQIFAIDIEHMTGKLVSEK